MSGETDSAAAAPHADQTLDELRLALAPRIAAEAAFDGWSDGALEQAAALAGVPASVARLAFSGGAMDMIEAWISAIDARMEAAFAGGELDRLAVRDRIRTLVLFRLDAVAGETESLRRALAIMALPQNIARALRTGWRSADAMWRLAGDRATDYNHYTKRALLGAIYSATLAVYVNDESEGQRETRAFLDRRIEDVMRIGKATGRLSREREGFDVVRFLGRLRYPDRARTP